jgi:hypothetical protein
MILLNRVILERAGLGCQAKNQPCFSGSAGRGSASAISAIVLGLFKRRADLLSGLGAGKKKCGLLASVASEQNNANR